jgi:hypothetical protein
MLNISKVRLIHLQLFFSVSKCVVLKIILNKIYVF